MKRQKINLINFLLIVYDFLAVACSYLIASLSLGLTDIQIALFDDRCFYTAAIFAFCYLSQYMSLGLFRELWKYSNVKNYIKLSFIVSSSGIASMLLSWIYKKPSFLDGYITLFAIAFAICALVFPRYVRYYVYQTNHANSKTKSPKNAMIIGAGWTGTALVREMQYGELNYLPKCILDDNASKTGGNINGVPIIANTNKLSEAAKKYNVDVIFFAIPSATPTRRKEILSECVKTGCEVKTVPALAEIFENSDIMPQIKDVKIEDLLGRAPVRLDDADVKNYIKDKACLVTGGGGSIGSELCRQIAAYKPKRLVILDEYENSAYDIQQELTRKYGKALNLQTLICTVRDREKLRLIFKANSFDVIFHAAAHKHVPLMETVPEETVKNNVVGTLNLCALAAEFNVGTFVLISTDKAVNPTNVMGASKRCCEMIVKTFAQENPNTRFCSVRFGNVLGSNGSVIPLFKRQMAEGGPVTVTHKEIYRYFMTIPEAVSLVLQAGTLAKSGEIFVLDMGKPVNILSMAENLIRLSGYEPYTEMPIIFTGLRPGEKLYEELLLNDENDVKTKFDRIMISTQSDVDEEKFTENLSRLIALAEENKTDEMLSLMKSIIPTFERKV